MRQPLMLNDQAFAIVVTICIMLGISYILFVIYDLFYGEDE